MTRLFVALLLWAGLVWATEPPPTTGSHAALLCIQCHEDSEVPRCSQCHDDAANPHPVGFIPADAFPQGFPPDEHGRLVCNTCHELHGGFPENSYLRPSSADCSGTRREFCESCHHQGYSELSPHRATKGQGRCLLCHRTVQEEPGRGDAPLRGNGRLCNFCHGAVGQGHPSNLAPRLPLPPDLPLAADGTPTCSTCHDPHGTASTTHFLRPQFARHFGRGQEDNPHQDSYFACAGCHTRSFANEICPPDCRLLYGGDINTLCLSCHTVDSSHHPTGIPLPEAMQLRADGSNLPLPLDQGGRITCYTCHDNGCATGEQQMRLRYYNRSRLDNSLCWACHLPREFSSVNPHVDTGESCKSCHAKHPTPGRDGAQSLMTTPKMLCLRCHEPTPHPGGVQHVKPPTAKVSVSPDLPLGRRGEISCITCHDPHLSTVPIPQRLRLVKRRLCKACHQER